MVFLVLPEGSARMDDQHLNALVGQDLEGEYPCTSFGHLAPNSFLGSSVAVRHAWVMNTLASYELEGHIATITYNRPRTLNAINAEMRRALNDAFTRFRDDEEAWVAIVTGAGKAFCVGADIHEGAGATGEFSGTFWEKPTVNSFESGWEIFKPVIAAVNGYCLGYGLTLVTWCDFVIASDR